MGAQDNPASVRRNVLDVVERLLPQIQPSHAETGEEQGVTCADASRTGQACEAGDMFVRRLALGLLEHLEDPELASRNQVRSKMWKFS